MASDRGNDANSLVRVVEESRLVGKLIVVLVPVVSLKLLGLISCENLWLLIARHSALQERGANDQVIRSLDD
jgi:hypothetical protein